jgi:hypothetical protein
MLNLPPPCGGGISWRKNRFKNINHGDTADTAKNQKPVFAFASRRVRRVAVVNCFFKIHYTPRS